MSADARVICTNLWHGYPVSCSETTGQSLIEAPTCVLSVAGKWQCHVWHMKEVVIYKRDRLMNRSTSTRSPACKGCEAAHATGSMLALTRLLQSLQLITQACVYPVSYTTLRHDFIIRPQPCCTILAEGFDAHACLQP